MSHLGALISALLDGELTPAEQAEADAHLLTCAACRAEVADTRSMRDLVRQLPRLEWEPSRLARRDRRPVLGLAAVAAVALVGVVAWPPARTAVPPVRRLVAARTVAAFTPSPVATVPMAAVSAPFHAPDALAGGYHRMGQYRQGTDIGVLYSDGNHAMVLFEQAAHLDSHAMPPGGQLVALGAWTGVAYGPATVPTRT
jgi:predicted anti-sigma-YlaC factor YlaD